MKCATELLCAIHTDVKSLINALELPVCDWEDKWLDVYLDNSVKLLDICNAFSSEISRMKQGYIFLQCALHNFRGTAPNQLKKARSSLDEWKQHINSKNPRLEKCIFAMDGLAQSLNLPKIKNSAKGKVLMRAVYGVRVVTLSICSIFDAIFSGSARKLVELQVLEGCLWAEAFTNFQTCVNIKFRNTYNRRAVVLKELESVHKSVENLHQIFVKDGVDSVEAGMVQEIASDLGKSAEKLSRGLDLVVKEVDRFFQIVLTGRNALLDNLRFGSKISDGAQANKKVEGLMVR
ncbi:protein BPS1, chloroplastic-like isoform X2 [Andrographis paniculata]|nr:protein BPS1, chloroplastic-like isoform X2 [Andrographis paniculata]